MSIRISLCGRSHGRYNLLFPARSVSGHLMPGVNGQRSTEGNRQLISPQADQSRPVWPGATHCTPPQTRERERAGGVGPIVFSEKAGKYFYRVNYVLEELRKQRESTEQVHFRKMCAIVIDCSHSSSLRHVSVLVLD